MDSSTPLIDQLTLEPIEVNLFRGSSPSDGGSRIFGGLVVAQALMAAYQTVPKRLCHSLHAYFIRPGDAHAPVLYEVDRARDGRSFTTRRVTAIQHGEQIFNLAASFQEPEDGFEHQAPAPTQTLSPQEATDRFQRRAARWRQKGVDPALIARAERPRPIEMRSVDDGSVKDGLPVQSAWLRAREAVPDDQRLHQVVLAYASDLALLPTAWAPHRKQVKMSGLQTASLDHAMWFHHPVDVNAWHLYAMDSPSASGARGFTRGSMFTEDGKLVASVVQEGLIRYREPEPEG